ncbi:hypothetical protein TURU_135732 [Turdus rufiventris]|nr:hypothetical protein TURU_135732 [Turdus rufiventris]
MSILCKQDEIPVVYHSCDLSEVQATPYPRGFKCFTCEKASDNYECNRWAPDVYCPRGTRYCLSQHMMKASGESVSVTKRCVALEECLSTGCTYIKHEEYKEPRGAVQTPSLESSKLWDEILELDRKPPARFHP